MPTLNGEHHIYPLNSPNSVGERNEWESVDSEEDERQQSELESLGHLCSRRRSRSGSSHLSSSSSSVSADLAREEAEVQEKIEVMPSISSASSSSSSSSSPEMRSTVQKRGRRESKTKGVLQKAREKVNSRGVLPLVRSSASDSERRGDHYEAAEGERGGVGRESAERISSFGWSHFERIVEEEAVGAPQPKPEDASSGGPKVKKLPSRLPSNPPTEKAEGGQGTTPKTPQVPGTSALTPGTKSRPAPVPATPSQAPSPEATAAGSPLSKEGRKGEGGSEKVEEGSPQPQGAEEGGGMAGPPALSLPIPRGKGRSSILKKDTPGSRWGNLMEIPQGPEEMEGAKGPAPPRGGKAEPLGSFKRPVLVPLHTDDWKEEATENWTEEDRKSLQPFSYFSLAQTPDSASSGQPTELGLPAPPLRLADPKFVSVAVVPELNASNAELKMHIKRGPGLAETISRKFEETDNPFASASKRMFPVKFTQEPVFGELLCVDVKLGPLRGEVQERALPLSLQVDFWADADAIVQLRESEQERLLGSRVHQQWALPGGDAGTAFHLAAFKGYKDTLKQMMKKIDFEFQLNRLTTGPTRGRTPLHLSALGGQSQVALMLIEKGSDLKARDVNGMTPVHLAAMEGHAETVTQLLYMGADVNEKTNDGTTPLHLAALNGQVDVAQSLVENEADVYAEDANSNTPLHLAAENGQEKAATVLLNNGADMTEKQEELLSPEAADRLFSWAPELRSLDYLRTLCGDSEAAAKAGTKGLGKMFDVLLSRAVTRRDPLCFCLEAIRVCKQRDRLVDDYLSHEFRKGTERLRFLCNLLLATEDAEGLVKRGGRRLLHLVASTDEREMARHPDIVKALEEENNPLPFYGIDGMFNPSSWRMMMFVSLLLLICSCFLSASGLVVLVGDPDLTITAETIRQVLQTPLGVPIIAVVYLSICHLHVELREMLATHPGQYLSSPLNILEALAYVMLIIGTIVALLSDVMAANLYTMLILCGFTLSLRILVYAMSLNYVGALVFTAVRMMGDVMIFSVLLVFLLVIFSATVFFLAQSYPALVEYEDLPTFQSFENTFLDLFNSLIGLYEPNVYPFQAAVDVGATVVALFIVLWMIVAVIMMLNFLIALMSKSYDTVEKDTAGYIALFRLRLWATVTALSPEVRLPPFISLWFFWLTWVKRKVNSENYDDSPGYRMFVNCVVIVQFACYAPFMIFQITSLRGTRRRILWLVIWFVTIALYPLVVFLAGAAFICAPQKRLKWWSQPGHINLEMSWLTQSPDLAARETNEKHVKIRTGALEQLRLEELKTAAVQVDVKRKITRMSLKLDRIVFALNREHD